jgi:anti-sigma factor RsiW
MTDAATQAQPDDFRPHEDEELVAYLDGELDVESARRIEQRLASDEGTRRRLRELQNSWDMLDDLPRSEVDVKFAQSTVSMIAVRTAEEKAFAESRFVRRLGRWALAAAGMICAATLGYWTVHTISTADDRQLMRDMPVIENMDMYQSAESIDFLRQLSQSGLFNEESSDGL